jgi:predicted ATPase
MQAEPIERTVLSSVNIVEYPHVLAAREEMRRWWSLQLMNANKLRQSNSVDGPIALSANGDHLARTLARIERDEKYILNDISRDLSNLVPGLLKVEIEEDKLKQVYNIHANTQDERRFSSYALSDGTLRLLALVTLANDPEYQGVLCIEEPENGVHPFCAEQIVEQMRSLSTDFTDEDDVAWPLRQLLVNTHSPLLLAQLKDKELLLAYMPTLIAPADGGDVGQVTRIIPTSRQAAMWSDQQTPISRHQIEKYLHSADWDAAVKRLVGDGAA